MSSLIETLNHWGNQFLNFAGAILWQSSLLIAILFALDFLLQHKIRAAIRYAFWLVVFLKLILPPTFASPTSPAWWWHKNSPSQKPQILHYTVTYNSMPLTDIPKNSVVVPPPKPKLIFSGWLLLTSFCVSVTLFVWLLARWRQISMQTRRAKISKRLTALAIKTKKSAGIKSKSNAPVKLTTNTMSPAVCGLLRPKILIPQLLAENFSDEQLRAVLLHEIFHLRRCDVWMNFAQSLLQIFYWWHPLLWLANARIRRVREEAVDDTVMLALRGDAATYAPTLLAVAKLALNRPLASLGLIGILESRSALRQRIERLLNFSAPQKAGITLLSLCGIFLFSAVALPMGEGPKQVEIKSTAVLAISQPAPMPGIFATTNFFGDLRGVEKLVQDAKLLYETGKLDEAKAKLKMALATNPNNRTAIYYSNLITQAEQQRQLRKQINSAPPAGSAVLGRRNIISIIHNVRLPHVAYNNLPLDEVLRNLTAEIAVENPDKLTFEVYKSPDLSSVTVTVNPPLTNDSVEKALEAIISGASKPIECSILDGGVEFSLKNQTSPTLYSRHFRINPNIFFTNLGQPIKPSSTNLDNKVTALKEIFSSAGVDMTQPGKAIFYNEGLGQLYVRASLNDFDTIEKILSRLSVPEPQLHIKARFMELPKGTMANFGYLLQATNSTGEGLMGILNAQNTKIILRSLESRKNSETLAEPEVITTSGRQTEMRSTRIISVVTNAIYEKKPTNYENSIVFQSGKIETGPVLDIIPYALSDGYTINLTLIPSLTEFLGYDKPTNAMTSYNSAGEKIDVPEILPKFRVRQMVTTLNLWDGQTAIIGGLPERDYVGGKEIFERTKSSGNELFVFITVTIVDTAGNRIHSDSEMRFAANGIPPQPTH